MRNDDKRVPALRLEGFEGEWRDTVLGDLIRLRNGQDYKHLGPGPVPVYGTGGYMGSVDQALSWNDDAVGIGRKGTIDKPYKLHAPFWTVDTLFYAIPKEGVDVDFLLGVLRRVNWRAYNQASGLPSLSSAVINEIRVSVPHSEEQRAIGTSLRDLDLIIDATVSKSDSLISLKQTMLVKMFPQGTASVPEVRFEAFGGEWKARRLGDLSESFSGGTPAASHASFYGGAIPFIRSAEIGSETTALTLTSEGLRSSSARIVETGDVLYALYGATAGEVGLAKLRGAINQAILAIYPDNTLDREFLVYWFTQAKRRILDTYLQGGQGNLSGTLVKSFELEIPPLPEQQAIGTYFRSLDALIDAEQKKLETLRNLKSALLTQMFV